MTCLTSLTGPVSDLGGIGGSRVIPARTGWLRSGGQALCLSALLDRVAEFHRSRAFLVIGLCLTTTAIDTSSPTLEGASDSGHGPESPAGHRCPGQVGNVPTGALRLATWTAAVAAAFDRDVRRAICRNRDCHHGSAPTEVRRHGSAAPARHLSTSGLDFRGLVFLLA